MMLLGFATLSFVAIAGTRGLASRHGRKRGNSIEAAAAWVAALSGPGWFRLPLPLPLVAHFHIGA
jgi:hypothetical protein